MLVLMKKRIMGEKCMKNGEFHHFWAISATCTGTGENRCGRALQNRTCTDIGAEQVRYSLQNRTCTGTGQSCTGTSSALFFYFNQHSYFSHNLLISYPI